MNKLITNALAKSILVGLLSFGAIGCAEKKAEVVQKEATATVAVAVGGPDVIGGDSTWMTTATSGRTITFMYPTNVPAAFKTIDLSKYSVQFVGFYGAVTLNATKDSLLKNVPILILDVMRIDPSTNPIVNNYVGWGIADQPVPVTLVPITNTNTERP